MPPDLALFLWFVLLLALFRFDPAKDSEASAALWLPLTYMFIVGTRLPSQWLGLEGGKIQAQVFQNGNPVDRTIWTLLILLAIASLVSRSFKWEQFFTSNLALTAFLFFALVSVTWSSFPYIAFKRWFRDLGGYLVVLVALYDPHPLEAVRTVLRRFAYLVIPLCILLDKYFRYMAVQYEPYSGQAMFCGATTSKNMLGLLCVVSGIFFFWDTLTRWSGRKEPRTKRIILVNVAFIAMTLYVLKLAHSATSSVCLALGCLVIALAHTKMFKRRPGFLKVIAPGLFCLYLILVLGFGMSGALNQAVGRQANFTDRTFIWKALLSMHTNPLVGVGYQSFWLGSWLTKVWQIPLVGKINEAHNGYLEIYLELGLIGLFLLVAFLVASYRTICKRLKPMTPLGSLSMALFTVVIFYNVTEAAIGPNILWIVFVLLALPMPEANRSPIHAASLVETGGGGDALRSPYEMPDIGAEGSGAGWQDVSFTR